MTVEKQESCGGKVTTQSLGQAEKLFVKAKQIAYHSYRS